MTPDSSATMLATGTPSPLGTTLRHRRCRVTRVPSGSARSRRHPTVSARLTLVRAGDLDIYRNPHARPRAWFVHRVTVADPSLHASAMHTQPFDTARDAWLASRPSHGPSTTARVTSVSLDDDRRTIGVDAPDGGVLVIGDRAHSGWDVSIDGHAVVVAGGRCGAHRRRRAAGQSHRRRCSSGSPPCARRSA